MPNIINLNDYNLSVDTKRELNLFKKKFKNVSLNNYIKFEKLIKIIYE